MDQARIGAPHELKTTADVKVGLAGIDLALDVEVELIEDGLVVFEVEGPASVDLAIRIIEVIGPAEFDMPKDVDPLFIQGSSNTGLIQQVHEGATWCGSAGRGG